MHALQEERHEANAPAPPAPASPGSVLWIMVLVAALFLASFFGTMLVCAILAFLQKLADMVTRWH